VLPYYTTTSETEEGETNGIQNHFGLQVAYGVTPKFDLRMRVENIWEKGGQFGDGITIMGLGPKFSLVENKLAIYLPIGRALGESTSDTWQFQPSVLYTLPAIKNKLDINLSPKYIFTFCEECPDFAAVNLGLAISSNLSKWAIRRNMVSYMILAKKAMHHNLA